MRGRGAPRPVPSPLWPAGVRAGSGGVFFCSFSVLFLLSGIAPGASDYRLGLWASIGSSWFSFVFERKFESDKPLFAYKTADFKTLPAQLRHLVRATN